MVKMSNTKEERACEDCGGGAGAGYQHGKHACPKHQLLCQWRYNLVPQPAHVAQTQRPEAWVDYNFYPINEPPGAIHG